MDSLKGIVGDHQIRAKIENLELTLLTNNLRYGHQGQRLFWWRILETKEEARWRKRLGTCQIR